MVDLGTLGASESSATGINDRGDVVGNSALADFSFEHGFFDRDGIMSDLGTLPGGSGSHAAAINQRDQVTGYAGAPDGRIHAFLYRDGGMQDLGAPSGYLNGAGLALNDRDEVVGEADMGGEATVTAFIWSNGVWRDLNSLIPPNSGWFLSVAAGIDARGEIVGTGSFDGSQRAFVLTPR
jgi:probable HAF family extracellular repeat protein